MTQFGQAQTTQLAVWRPMYPMFTPGDVVLEAQTGDRFKVEKRKVVAEKRGVPIQQVLLLELMPRSAVTKLLDVPSAVIRGLVDDLVGERQLVEF